ncbi:hypothetical protein GCM10009560_06960 [Nonomuraea longicatena]|uniref:Uncharacterized protein n=1 Tax=Nonomuraea longicatena TaxID=83682 RepID=A0ABN1NQA1_9ACTN
MNVVPPVPRVAGLAPGKSTIWSAASRTAMVITSACSGPEARTLAVAVIGRPAVGEALLIVRESTVTVGAALAGRAGKDAAPRAVMRISARTRVRMFGVLLAWSSGR